MDVCPVDAFGGGEVIHASRVQLFIDPDTCIDCGACAPECPVDAIADDGELPAQHIDIIRNAAFFTNVNTRGGHF